MKQWLDFNAEGDLPIGVHQATLKEVIEHFGNATRQRILIARRLERIYSLVMSSGCVARFIIYGSFITSKPEPNDVDIFLVMTDDFDVDKMVGEVAICFNHLAAQNHEGASIFWSRRLGLLGGEYKAINDWQIKRDGSKRGIVEVNNNDKE